MKAATVIKSTGICLLLAGAGILHANMVQPDQAAVAKQVQVMEHAITASSVSDRYAPEERQQKLSLVAGARESLREGHVKTAADQLEQAARMLYPMKEYNGIPLAGDKQQRWVFQMERVIDALLPVARDIAAEKSATIDMLAVTDTLYEQGRLAAAGGDLNQAERLLTNAYLELQRALVELRSGDLLVIEQPDAGTQAAWKEAVRRYEDWRFFADWMERSSEELGIDPGIIAQGSKEADRIFQQARDEAQQGDWRVATDRIDQAYLTLEDYWREAGVDI
ncbi:hypothetical protein [Motiliproteus sediminis]|uniref:hypothetical protein n=1 Tax=Motiliproteus sediminis TaxID=1468178 RepID=UPI001AEFFF0D|nr:hypothetical protein [Motiliproteus sediminis]